MRRKLPVLAVLLLTGCSTAPIADFMDHFMPARIATEATPGQRTRGGVCDPAPQTPAIRGGNPANVPLAPAVPGVPTAPGSVPMNELPPVDRPPEPAIRF